MKPAEIARSIAATKNNALSQFFTAKTHKQVIRFRAIVSDKGGMNSRRTLTGRHRPLASCLCYQLGERQWTQLPDLQVPRAYHGCAAVQGTLFAIGGRDKRGRLLDSIECWDPSSQRWRVIPEPMSFGRMGAAVAASGNVVYVAGGLARTDDGRLWLLTDVDCYDIQASRWFRGPRLPWPVCLGSLVATGSGVLVHVGGLSLCPEEGVPVEKVLVVGGTMHGNAFQQTPAVDAHTFRSRSDVLFWDPSGADRRWKSLCPLPEPRHGSAAAVCINEDTLYVLGGLSTSSERAPLEVLAASTADSSDRSFYRACQLPGPIVGSLALPLPDVATVPVTHRRSSSS
ncbi:hypothetical protein MRX96_034234 [Rhipicephalus microplus]